MRALVSHFFCSLKMPIRGICSGIDDAPQEFEFSRASRFAWGRFDAFQEACGALSHVPKHRFIKPSEKSANRFVENDLVGENGPDFRLPFEVLVAADLGSGGRAQEASELHLGKAGAATIRAQIVMEAGLGHGVKLG